MKDLIFRPPGAERDETLSAKASLVYVEPTEEDGDTDEEDEGGRVPKSRAVFPRSCLKERQPFSLVLSRVRGQENIKSMAKPSHSSSMRRNLPLLEYSSRPGIF